MLNIDEFDKSEFDDALFRLDKNSENLSSYFSKMILHNRHNSRNKTRASCSVWTREFRSFAK